MVKMEVNGKWFIILNLKKKRKTRRIFFFLHKLGLKSQVFALLQIMKALLYYEKRAWASKTDWIICQFKNVLDPQLFLTSGHPCYPSLKKSPNKKLQPLFLLKSEKQPFVSMGAPSNLLNNGSAHLRLNPVRLMSHILFCGAQHIVQIQKLFLLFSKATQAGYLVHVLEHTFSPWCSHWTGRVTSFISFSTVS